MQQQLVGPSFRPVQQAAYAPVPTLLHRHQPGAASSHDFAASLVPSLKAAPPAPTLKPVVKSEKAAPVRDAAVGRYHDSRPAARVLLPHSARVGGPRAHSRHPLRQVAAPLGSQRLSTQTAYRASTPTERDRQPEMHSHPALNRVVGVTSHFATTETTENENTRPRSPASGQSFRSTVSDPAHPSTS